MSNSPIYINGSSEMCSLTAGVTKEKDGNLPTLVESSTTPTDFQQQQQQSTSGGGNNIMSDDVGRAKANPVCVAVELKSQAMDASQLIGLAFDLPPGAKPVVIESVSTGDGNLVETNNVKVESSLVVSSPESHPIPASVSMTTSASMSLGSTSGSTHDCDVVTLSDTEMKTTTDHGSHSKIVSESEKLNARIIQRKTSRQGRATQRWVSSDNHIGEPIRLVVGTVPILKGGKILFVSASRKPEWILPKGGWEGDETMEESAVRESYEEAGVIGILGSPLTPVQHETRKSKKRRLERGDSKVVESPPSDSEEKITQVPPVSDHDDRSCSATTAADNMSEADPQSFSSSTTTIPFLSMEELSRIRNQYQGVGKQQPDETLSVGSTLSATYSYVKMTLFPLYVTQVLESWPESGRFRTAVDIDTAIEMMEGRPEFKTLLIEIKSRGLHLVDKADGSSCRSSVPS